MRPRPLLSLVAGVGVAFSATADVAAQEVTPAGWTRPFQKHHRPRPAEECPPATLMPPGFVPPATPAPPVAPTPPGVTPAPETPTPTPAPAPAAPTAVAEPFAQATEAGTQPATAFNPNMFGDLFGRPIPLFIQQRPRVVPGVPAQTFARSFVISDATNPGQPATLQVTGPNALTTVGGLTVLGSNLGPQTFPTANALQPVPPATAILLENPGVTGAIAAANPGVVVAYVSGSAALDEIIGSGQATYTAEPLNYNLTTPAIPDQLIPRPAILLLIPNPTGGGAVGRTKISDDNNPIPRDRLIFNYDYFHSVPLGTGVNVHRYSPGFEKTFFDRRASFELRFPFASTLSSDVVAGGVTAQEVQFGNINLTLKGLFHSGPVLNVAAGLGIALPTADDTRVRLPDGTPVLRVENDAVLLTPFVAALWTPDDRFFAQGWLSFGFDPRGNPVAVNPAFFGLRNGRIGNLEDSTLMSCDLQVGYWLHRSNGGGGLTGLAPFLEVHYNGTVSNGSVLSAGRGFFIGDVGGSFDEVNVTGGLTALFGDNLVLSVGAAIPTRPRDDRTFDYQFGARVNWFFGPTAGARDRATAVSSY